MTASKLNGYFAELVDRGCAHIFGIAVDDDPEPYIPQPIGV